MYRCFSMPVRSNIDSFDAPILMFKKQIEHYHKHSCSCIISPPLLRLIMMIKDVPNDLTKLILILIDLENPILLKEKRKRKENNENLSMYEMKNELIHNIFTSNH